MCVTLFTNNILTLECRLSYQSLGVCEVSDPYLLHCEILGKTHCLISCGCFLLFTTWKGWG